MLAFRFHWPEYLMESGELALYMFVLCSAMTLLQHPDSPIRHLIASGFWRRVLMGLVMGATVIATIRSPWGRQSGAHFNPVVTFTFYRLGKIHPWDAGLYIAAQFLGGISGVAIAHSLFHDMLSNTAIRYAVTAPGVYGPPTAFLAEFSISLISMTTVLFVSNWERMARATPYLVGTLVALYITFETPFSGMSMNPARTLGSALHARYWHSLWIYFAAPLLGMLSGAELFLWARNGARPYCAKLYHTSDKRCIFNCGYRSKVEDQKR